MQRTSRNLHRSTRSEAWRRRPQVEGLEEKRLLSTVSRLSSEAASIIQSVQLIPNSDTPRFSAEIPAFSGVQPLVQVTPTLSLNPINITYGTALANSQITGTATDNSVSPPVSVPGTFTYTSSAGTVLGAGNNQSEGVTFTPDDTVDYTTATSTATVNVGQATPTLSVNPVNINVGTALNNSQLVGTALWTVNGSTVTVLGSFTYTTATGSVPPAGSGQSEDVTFTPGDTTNYTVATGTVTVNVGLTPTVSVNPVDITYGAVLANSQLSGTATYTSGSTTVPVPGTFTYTSAAGTLLNAGVGQSEAVTFTPTDTSTYNPTSTTVVVNVAQAAPVITVTGVTATYGGPNSSHPATGTAFGVVPPPQNLTALLQLSYKDVSTGTVSTSAPVNVGTYEILASFTGNSNYLTINQQDTGQQVVVLADTTSFTEVSSPTVTVGSILTTISGTLTSNTSIPSGSVEAEFNGPIYTTTVRADGTFVLVVPTLSLVPGVYQADIIYSGNANLAPAFTTVTSTVTLGVASLLNNNIVYSQGSVVPISIMIVDDRNEPFRSKHRTVTATAIALASDPNTLIPLRSGSSSSGRFRANRAGDQYSYGLRTRGLAPGEYILYVSTNDDPLPHTVPFIIGKRVFNHT